MIIQQKSGKTNKRTQEWKKTVFIEKHFLKKNCPVNKLEGLVTIKVI